MSVLEDELAEYFDALVAQVEVRAREQHAAPVRAADQGRRRVWLVTAAAAFTVVTLVIAVALSRSGPSSPGTTTNPAGQSMPTPEAREPFSPAPQSPWPAISDAASACVPTPRPVVWIAVWEGGQGCWLVAEDQRLDIVNKGDSVITVPWDGSLHEIPPDGQYRTGRLGDAFGEGSHEIPITPYPPVRIIVMSASSSLLFAAHDFDTTSLGPFRLGVSLSEIVASYALPLVWAGDPTALPRCRAVLVVNDPYAPLLTVAQKASGETVVASLSVWSPYQRGPGGIRTGMSRAQLEAATESRWRATDIRRADHLGDQFLVWSDDQHGTEIVAALADDRTQQFIVRYTVNSLRDLGVEESPSGECTLS